MDLKKKFLRETFDLIERIENVKTFRVESNYEMIHDIELTLEKGERCFKFNAPSINIVVGMVEYQNKAYGFSDCFRLKSETLNLVVKKGAGKTVFNLGSSSLSTEGEIFEFEESFEESSKIFFRIVLPRSENPRDDHDNFLFGECYSYENSTSRGFTEFNCDGNVFHLFTYYNESRSSIIIDCMSPIILLDMEKSKEAIIYSLGLISGFVPKNEMYIFQSEDSDFTKIKGFRFSKLEDTIATGMQIIDPELFSGLKKLNSITGHLTPEIFSNLTTNAVLDVRFLRALKIISLANKYPLEIQASAYSVALETTKNIILEKHSEKINPFQERKFAQSTILQLKEVISSIDDSKFNNKEVVIKKLEQLNQMTNRDGFTIVFDLYNFPLNESDKWALERRNDFLHGRIPFDDELLNSPSIELRALSYKLHFLVTGLLLKYSGYSGLLKNNPMYYKLLNGIHENEEYLFRKV